MPSLRPTLLGTGEGHLASGEPLDIPKKALALLAYLALAPDGCRSRTSISAAAAATRAGT
jgi:hypothetical protein